MVMLGFERAWKLHGIHPLSLSRETRLCGRILLMITLQLVAFGGACPVGHPVWVSLLSDRISRCLQAGCRLSSSSMGALLQMGSERTRSDSLSGITWSSQRRKSHSGTNSLSWNGEQGRKSSQAKGKVTKQLMLRGKSGLAGPWKKHPSHPSRLALLLF